MTDGCTYRIETSPLIWDLIDFYMIEISVMIELNEEYGKLIKLGKTTFEPEVMLVLFRGKQRDLDLRDLLILVNRVIKKFL